MPRKNSDAMSLILAFGVSVTCKGIRALPSESVVAVSYEKVKGDAECRST